ncbi:hypothetical protein SAY87_025582 [Trapa incisa]|uniref:Embryo defective 1381 n=1 Tax=Trapa incisa TaxID=236973 RepID=A0AAN7GHW9_9MYRT|nr:hypothetical protein SAY87_025582 [Trapa incisa]
MVRKAWRIIPRPLMESILNHHAHHDRVTHPPIILHGPRGVGKTTLIHDRLLGEWNKGPHVTGYVDFAEAIKDHHPQHDGSFPWYSWSNCELPPLSVLRGQLEQCLESMAQKGVKLGSITSQQVFTTLKKWHGLNTALRQVLVSNSPSKNALSDKVTGSVLWGQAIFALSSKCKAEDIDGILELDKKGKGLSVEEATYFRESIIALKLAKEVIAVQQRWRSNAIAHFNQIGGGFSRTLAHSCTDWPCLLLELLSQAADSGYFQPKLVINNIEVLRNAILTDDLSVNAPMYHDSLIWRITSLGVNDSCIPVILVTSDSYYSFHAFLDVGFPDAYISRELFAWTPEQAKMHMVDDYFSKSEWLVISEVLGPNPRHLFELYTLKQSNYYYKVINDKSTTFEDIVDAYLAYLQVTVVNPAIDRSLKIIKKFAADAQSGRISKDKLHFGAPWRHPPPVATDSTQRLDWAKLQLIDFLQSLVSTEFGVNYLVDCTHEVLDDPAVVAMLEVGLLYLQRQPSYIRPVSRAIQRCLVRWLVQERMKMTFFESVQFHWQRFFRGRSYRHLMGNKN